MTTEELIDKVKSLSAEEQTSVIQEDVRGHGLTGDNLLYQIFAS